MKVVLASTSRWRAQLLEQSGVRCEVLASGVDEGAFAEMDPARRAEGLAVAKARAVAERIGDPLAAIIGADQVAHLNGAVLHKPKTLERHREQLHALRGETHELVTGVCVLRAEYEVVFHETSSIHFRIDLSDAEIEDYLTTGEGRRACGGYQIEGLGPQLIHRVEGDWFNVVGLPILRVVTELRSMGWRPEFAAREDG